MHGLDHQEAHQECKKKKVLTASILNNIKLGGETQE